MILQNYITHVFCTELFTSCLYFSIFLCNAQCCYGIIVLSLVKPLSSVSYLCLKDLVKPMGKVSVYLNGDGRWSALHCGIHPLTQHALWHDLHTKHIVLLWTLMTQCFHTMLFAQTVVVVFPARWLEVSESWGLQTVTRVKLTSANESELTSTLTRERRPLVSTGTAGEEIILLL